MTDYSKLSDAEIAEMVCRKLGAPVGEDYYSAICWVTEIIPAHEDSFNYEIYYKSGEDDNPAKLLYLYICFDWPAPIMMQKVEEWLIKRDIGPSLDYCIIDRLWYCYIDCTQFGFQFGEMSVDSNRKPRALYEAFLQVDNV